MDSSLSINLKRTINCSVTRANRNEPSYVENQLALSLLCDVFAQQWKSSHENFQFIVT